MRAESKNQPAFWAISVPQGDFCHSLLEAMTVFAGFWNTSFLFETTQSDAAELHLSANIRKCNKFEIVLKKRIDKEWTMVLGPESESKILNFFETIYYQA